MHWGSRLCACRAKAARYPRCTDRLTGTLSYTASAPHHAPSLVDPDIAIRARSRSRQTFPAQEGERGRYERLRAQCVGSGGSLSRSGRQGVGGRD